MRVVEASAFGPPDVLRLAERSDPTPRADEVLIRVARSGVNFAEVNARWGRYPERTPKPPYVPGSEVSGRVVSVGDNVQGFSSGQRVAAFTRGGSYAELAIAPESLTFALPDVVDWDAGAAFPIVACTAYLLLTSAGRLAPGENVLIHAAGGGVGTTATQMARLLGAGKILGTAGGPEKVQFAKSLGADEVFDYRAGEFAQPLLDATGGHGVDVALDAVGGDARRQTLDVLAHGGRLALFGNASAEREMEVSTRLLRDKQLTLTGFHLTAVRNEHPDVIRRVAEQIFDWIADGRLRLCVSEVIPLADAAEAHRRLESRASRGKLLLGVAEL